MKYYGKTSISEFLGDNVIYRNLVPMDKRLPTLDQLRGDLGLAPGNMLYNGTPRKMKMAYAQAVAQMLKAARELNTPGIAIERVVFIGDTHLNDVTAFSNICRAGKWTGLAFIGEDNKAEPQVKIEEVDVGAVMIANRWSALNKFHAFCEQRGFEVDEKTAVLLDLDKTTIGGRGRNDRMIDQARLDAAFQTVSSDLGDRFDPAEFRKTYDYFNQSRFHAFTTDNQDYLVYVCLMIGYGLFTRYGLRCALENEVVTDFESFLVQVDRRSMELPEALKAVHQDVLDRFRAGDPTPFKAFRRAEYLAKVKRMGQLGPETSPQEILSREIVITQEVRALALAWRDQGALTFGLSDKPDEATTPTEELAAQGYQPIHRIEMGVVGSG